MAKDAKAVIDAIKRHANEALALEGKQAAEFLRLLRELKERLLGRLAAAPGMEQDRPFDAMRIGAVLAETKIAIRALEQKALSGFTAAQRDAAEMAADHLGSEIGLMSRAFEARRYDVHLDTAKVLADPTQGLLAEHFESSVQRYGLDVLNNVRRDLFVGIRTGDPYRDVVRGVASTIEGSKAQAERLVRTEVAQANGVARQTATVEAARSIPGIKKVWFHAGSYPCPVCVPLHNTERPVDGTWTIRQGKNTRTVPNPPGHPNCVCRSILLKASWRGALDKLGYLNVPAATAREARKAA